MQLDMQDRYSHLQRTMITPGVNVKLGEVIGYRQIKIFEEDHDAEVGHEVASFSCKDSRQENQTYLLVELDLILEFEVIISKPLPQACLYSYADGCHQ